jgi:molybdopterin-guanine dinucleotide biosynthesis protein A
VTAVAASFGTAILTGGEGRRLGGIPKGAALYQGITLLDRTLANVRSLGGEVHLIVKNPDDYRRWNLPAWVDLWPRRAPIVGIHTALVQLAKDHVLVLAVDLPGLTAGLLAHLVACRTAAEVVIPRWNGRWEPLCAVYSRSVIPRLEAMIRRDELKPVDLLDQVTVREIAGRELRRFGDPARLFMNINTPADLNPGAPP